MESSLNACTIERRSYSTDNQTGVTNPSRVLVMFPLCWSTHKKKGNSHFDRIAMA